MSSETAENSSCCCNFAFSLARLRRREQPARGVVTNNMFALSTRFPAPTSLQNRPNQSLLTPVSHSLPRLVQQPSRSPRHPAHARAAHDGKNRSARRAPRPPARRSRALRRVRVRAGSPRGRAPGVGHLRGAGAVAVPAPRRPPRGRPLRAPAVALALPGHNAAAPVPGPRRRRAGAVGRGGHHPVQPEPAQPRRARAGLRVRALRLRRARRRLRDAVVRSAATPRGVGGATGRGARGRHVVGVVDEGQQMESVRPQACRGKLASGLVGWLGWICMRSLFLKSFQ
uniref:Uncharacterized protein n=1 Tax=Aegilops tauschii subsp. strangulata TaxID=200361 RepID=A0A453GK83_AEGTS